MCSGQPAGCPSSWGAWTRLVGNVASPRFADELRLDEQLAAWWDFKGYGRHLLQRKDMSWLACHAKIVHGREKVLAGGQLRSPLVAMRSPRWWPAEVRSSLNIHGSCPSAGDGDGDGANQPPHRPRGQLHEISEGTHGHQRRLP